MAEDMLVDVGQARWPGVYFAVRYGCAVVGTVMPFDALAAASVRAGRERVAGCYVSVAAAGAQQPFRPAAGLRRSSTLSAVRT